MDGKDETVNLGHPVVDNVVHQATEQIVQHVHEVTSTLPPVAPEVISSTTHESIVSTIESVVTEATEVTIHTTIGVESSTTSTIVDHVSTFVENVVEPVVSEMPLEPQVIQETSTFVEPEQVVESITEKVTEYVSEATQEFTTLLAADETVTKDDAGKMSDRLLPKALLTHDYIQWLHETRLILAISVSMVYLFTIFFIRRLLSKRSPFHLRNMLTIWNLGLAAFSVACATVLARHLVPWAKANGLGSSLCSSPITDSVGLWLNLFTWSKLLELGNTLFVVLRKQKLRFIHVYYHLSTLIYVFYLFGGGLISAGDNISTPAYYPVVVFINVAVQGIIYTYYVFRSRGFAPPKILTMTLNLIHIIQFIVILSILLLSLYHHLSPSDPILSTLSSISLPASLSKLTLPASIASLTSLTSRCSPSMSIDIFGITIIGTNFILFANHFRSNYVKPKTIKLL